MENNTTDDVKEISISYCNCCGAKHVTVDGHLEPGQCYTDCMWYDGEEYFDENPH